MVDASVTQFLENLAADIGQEVYIDIAKWHLYLNDAHLHQLLAEQLYPMLKAQELQEDRVVEVLREIPVKVGGGRREVPLADLLPMQSQVNLMDILEKYQRKL